MRSFAHTLLLLLSTEVAAERLVPLRAIVSESNAPPYALFDDRGFLSAGISKDLLDALVKRSGLSLTHLPLPRGRVESWLLQDEADIACFLNPDWVENPEQLSWSPELFSTQQLLVRRSNTPGIQQMADLFGKRIGTDRGFNYPELELLFSQQLAIRDDANSLHSNLIRLEQQRLDVVLTVDLAYYYHQQKFGHTTFRTDPLWTKPDGVYCAFNPHQPALVEQLQQTLHQLVQDGTVAAILQRYQPAKNQ